MLVPTTFLSCGLVIGGVTPETFTVQLQSVVAELYAHDETTDTDEGVIISVDPEEEFFVLGTAENTRIRIEVDDATEYYLDGEQSTKEKVLRIGRNATVAHTERKAVRVDVTTEP